MVSSISQPILVGSRAQFKSGRYVEVAVEFRGQAHTVVVLELQQEVRAYLNWCVHMPRRLNSEAGAIVDDTGKHLRCSMHGIVYDPETGASMSTLCHGERLTGIKLAEADGQIWIKDKRVVARDSATA